MWAAVDVLERSSGHPDYNSTPSVHLLVWWSQKNTQTIPPHPLPFPGPNIERGYCPPTVISRLPRPTRCHHPGLGLGARWPSSILNPSWAPGTEDYQPIYAPHLCASLLQCSGLLGGHCLQIQPWPIGPIDSHHLASPNLPEPSSSYNPVRRTTSLLHPPHFLTSLTWYTAMDSKSSHGLSRPDGCHLASPNLPEPSSSCDLEQGTASLLHPPHLLTSLSWHSRPFRLQSTVYAAYLGLTSNLPEPSSSWALTHRLPCLFLLHAFL